MTYLLFKMLCISISIAAAGDLNATVKADFSRDSDEPSLSKSLFGVYQTPFWFKHHPPDGAAARNMIALLREAGVHDFRYELAWGKPDVFSAEQHQLDPVLKQIAEMGIAPLLVLGYCPDSLQSEPHSWQTWKAMPNDLQQWRQRCADESRDDASIFPHDRLAFEIWNEPDLPGDGGKVFFADDSIAYGRLYGAALAGIRGVSTTEPSAHLPSVGGPAIAYDVNYLTQSHLLDQPIDFVSVHAYGNAHSQLAAVRQGMRGRPLPIRLTEYASFPTDQLQKNIGGLSVVRFFADVKQLLAEPQLQKVYWAQWVDDSIGMLSDDLHRRPLFNAYTAYQTLMPTTRRPVNITQHGDSSLDAIAAGDASGDGVVIWNSAAATRVISVQLSGLPIHGSCRLFWIPDPVTSSTTQPIDRRLDSSESWRFASGHVSWDGTLPPESAVVIRIDGD